MTPSSWTKQPNEVRQLELDVTNALSSGDSVASVISCTVYDSSGTDVSASMISGTATVSSNKLYVTVQAGTHNCYYWLEAKVYTSNGDTIEDDLKIIVKDTRLL